MNTMLEYTGWIVIVLGLILTALNLRIMRERKRLVDKRRRIYQAQRKTTGEQLRIGLMECRVVREQREAHAGCIEQGYVPDTPADRIRIGTDLHHANIREQQYLETWDKLKLDGSPWPGIDHAEEIAKSWSGN